MSIWLAAQHPNHEKAVEYLLSNFPLQTLELEFALINQNFQTLKNPDTKVVILHEFRTIRQMKRALEDAIRRSYGLPLSASAQETTAGRMSRRSQGRGRRPTGERGGLRLVHSRP